jgi:nucleolin
MSKKNTKVTKPVSSDESSDEVVVKKTTKTAVTVKASKKQDSDSESVDLLKQKRKPSKDLKKPTKKAADSDDESSEVPAKKAPVKAPVKASKKAADSDDESSEVPVKKAPTKAAAVPAKVTKKAADSDDESSEVPVKKAPAKTAVPAKATKKPASSDDESSEVPAKKAPVKATKKPASSDDESSEVPAKKAPAKSAAPAEDTETHSELFVKNLSWQSTEDTVYNYFATFGTVTNVKLLTDKMTGKPKGIGFVAFEKRADAKKAMENISDIDGRTPTCSWSNDKAPATGGAAPGGFNSAPRSNFSGDSHTIFVGNLGFKTNEQSIRKFFERAGNIVGIRIAKHEDGLAKGFCHVDFDAAEAVQTSISYAGQDLDGRPIRVDASEPRKPREGGFGGGRGGFGAPRGGRGGNRGGPPRQSHGPMGGQGKKVTFDDDE